MRYPPRRLDGPDFIIAGGHECGTTSLYAMLCSHPGVEMSPVKEPHFLARRSCARRLHQGVWSATEYESLWRKRDGRSQRGEASVLYLTFAEEVCATIERELIRAPKVIVSVRNPIERARSSYLDTRLKNPCELAPCFEDAVARELASGPWRIDGADSPTLRHLALGRYSEGIRRFQAQLGRENVLVVLFDDFVTKPQQVVASIQAFIGVDCAQSSVPLHRNKGAVVWKNQAIELTMRSGAAVATRRYLRKVAPKLHQRFSRVVQSRFVTQAPLISPSVRKQLVELYKDEVCSLEELLGRSLSHWLE
ncbi:sulfotransferase domain-containing protein [Sinimarinibacterium thermocellulolyticum]|uniref:Sulfotransferase domain-containing protein n=1 Tax=Sinimarinibacterium thermocellulolyticum TaxID=3170016 RepID=A0ABV2A5H4_9GAMM